MKRFVTFLIVFLLGGMIFFAVNYYTSKPEIVRIIEKPNAAPVQQTGAFPLAAMNGPDFSEAAGMTVDAVVHIRSQFRTKSQDYDDFFGALREYLGYERRPNRSYPISGWGSGVIIASDGYIVTNNHVVEGAELVEVILNDKRVFEGEVIGLDPTTDLALLKIDATKLPYIHYGNSDDVKVGEWVLAVGNPFNLTSTVTAGIVSAKARDINILGSQGAIESFIQTDAAVNRGNSGGALVNTSGELIGINAAIASNNGYFQGYSFAIPVNIVKKVIGDLKEYGEVQRAYIGVVIREINQDFANDLGLEQVKGVYIDGLVDRGGAMDAGMEIGDVITLVNGTEVNSLAQLLEVVGQHSPGDKLQVEVIRDGEAIDYLVELRTQDGTTNVIRKQDEFYSERLGASLSSLSREEIEELGVQTGLKVVSLEDGLLNKGGIRKGFILLAVNGYNVGSESGLDTALEENPHRVRISGIYPNGMKVTFEFGL
jgi:Do/DeqQ family serine protease